MSKPSMWATIKTIRIGMFIMNKPSSTIQAAGISGFLAATALLIIKLAWPEIYVQIPPEYQGYLVTAIMIGFGYFKKENVLGNPDKATWG
jgi:hypothetical protein